MFKQWLIENAYQLITTFIGGTSFVAYILERKKRKIEEKQLTADALKSMQEAYDRFTEDFKERYTELSDRYDKLLDRYITLEDKFNQVSKELANIKTNINS